MSELEKAIRQRMNMQQANIDAQRASMQQMQQAPQQIDLTPMLAITDAWTGSNFARNYRAPESAQEKAYKRAMMEQGLQRQEMGLLDDQIKLLSALDKRNQKAATKKLDLTPFEKKRDESFAKTAQEWSDAGGYANIAGNLDLLKGVRNRLETPEGEDLVGTVQPKILRDVFNPASSEAQETVETVVQQSLKAILGGQFSEKEAKQLIERAYNPRLSPAINASKLTGLINKIEAAAKSKQDAFDHAVNKGSLKGHKGKVKFSLSDFEPGKGTAKKDSKKSRLEELRAKMRGK